MGVKKIKLILIKLFNYNIVILLFSLIFFLFIYKYGKL